MSEFITKVFTLMGSVFTMITGNPLFAILIGVIVIAFIVGIVTSVFNRRRGRRRG